MARLLIDANLLIVLILALTKVPSVLTQTTSSSGTTPPQSGTSAGQQTTANQATTQGGGNAPTTTALPPTTPAPPASTEVPGNTDIGTCICDLTGNSCDVNCCCDSDCTLADTQTFAECSENNYVVEDKACLRQSVVYLTNAQPETVDVSDPSLFCVFRDNYVDRNYYTVPQTVETVERFYELSQEYGGTSYALPSAAENQTYSNFYKSGDVAYTLYESLSLGQLGLPQGLASGFCDDNNPAAYLYDETSTCTRVLTSLERDCERQPYLSARTYYEGFKLVSTPQFLQDNPLPDPILVNLTSASPTTTLAPTTPSTDNATTSPTTLPPTAMPGFYDDPALVGVSLRVPVMCRIAFGFIVECNYTMDEVPLPSYNESAGTCDDVALQVKYIITHNSTDGIEEAEVELLLGSLTSDDLHLSQTFSTEYIKRDEEDVFPRSGNPGYEVGQPLLAGDLVEQVQPDETIKQAISLGPDPSNWLTVVKATADGSCVTDADSRTPVTFGENLRSGCTIQVSYENISDICGIIQSTALNALVGNNPGYVATFGNSQPEVVGDWVQILVDEISSNPVSNEQGACSNMYMTLHMEVLYANVGALANPQAKIIGVRYNYPDGSGQTIRYQCVGPYCQDGAESLIQNFEVAVSVEFIDASTSPTAAWAEKPAFQSKLPSDFFYPFTGSSDSKSLRSSVSCAVHATLLLMASMVLL